MSALRKKAEDVIASGEAPTLEDALAFAHLVVRFEEVAEELLACKQCLQRCRQEHTETLTQRRILQIMIETLAMTPSEERGEMLESVIERARGMR